MPETSKLGPAMEDAGKSATESFDKGSSFGEKIHDSFSKATGKVKDVFSHAGSDAGKAMSDSFEKETKGIEDAAEDAGKKATGKFGEAAKNLGGALIGAIGPETKSLLGNKIEEVVGDAVTGVIGDFGGKWGGKLARSVFDFGLDDLQKKLGDVKDAAAQTKQGFAALGGGDVTGALDGVSGLLGRTDTLAKLVGVDISGWSGPIKGALGPLQDVVDKTKAAQNDVKAFGDIFAGLPGIIGKVGTAISDLAGPIAVAFAAAKAGDQYAREHIPGSAAIQDARGKGMDAYSNAIGDQLNQLPGVHVPHRGPPTAPKGPLPPLPPDMVMGGVGGDSGFDALLSGGPSGIGASGGSDGGDLSGGMPALTTPPVSAASGASAGGASYNPSSVTSGISSPADLRRAGGNVANLFAVAQSLVGTPYSMPLRNDCSGMVSRLATAALGMAPTAAFSTANEGDWLTSHGFQPGLGGPGDLNIGWHNGGPGGGHTAATLPGGVNAESGGSVGAFALGGPVGAFSSQFENHAHLAMNGAPGGMAGGMGAPSGAQHDPIYTAQADAGAGGVGGSSSEDQAKQLGSGLVSGVLQEFGLDGSVFKSFGGSSNPLHFGITKLATGLINSFGGMLGGQTQGGDGASLGGLGGGGASILPGLGSLIPHPAAGAVPIGPGGAQNVNGGDTHIYGNAGPTLNVTQNGVQSPTQDLHETANGAGGRLPAMGVAPNSGTLPG